MFTKEAEFFKSAIIDRMRNDPENVKEELLKVPVDVAIKDDRICTAVLIDAPTQAGKTRKCFSVMQEKLKSMTEKTGNTLVLFITQANSTAGASQVKQRASNDPGFSNFNIRFAHEPSHGAGNQMVIGFWNSRNSSKMLDIVNGTRWKNTLIVIDECESGNLKGVKDRLYFIRAVDRKKSSGIVTVIFVTATIGNLSKNILCIAKENLNKFSTGVVHDIVNNRVVEHQFAAPAENYVGASWFVKNVGVWKNLKFGNREPDMSKEDHDRFKEVAVMKEIKRLPIDAKELTLFVTSTRTVDHARMAEKLVRFGYDVIVELNNTVGREYKVRYMNEGGDIANWNIPYKHIEALADSNELSTVRKLGKTISTGINNKDDLSLPHILQAALFMGTTVQKRIKEFADSDEYLKLKTIYSAMKRPIDFPDTPRVALITGNLASRGITFQNPAIDLTCTSFCFTDTKDAISRGATNTQRFGRACGMLSDVFARPGRQPILIATKGIMDAAVANEAAVMEKAKSIPNGTLLCLKDLITEDEWKKIVKITSKDTVPAITPSLSKDGKIDGVDIAKLRKWLNGDCNIVIARMVRYLYKMNKPITIDKFKEGIEYSGSNEKFINNFDNGRGEKCQYGKLWSYNDGRITRNLNLKW